MGIFTKKKKEEAAKLAESNMNYYQRTSHSVIDQIIGQERDRHSFEEISRSIRSAYPFGDKRGNPYKIWIKIVCKREKLLQEELAREIPEQAS